MLKKLYIKNQKPIKNIGDYEALTEKFESGINSLLLEQSIQAPLEYLYSIVDSLQTENKCKILFNKLQSIIENDLYKKADYIKTCNADEVLHLQIINNIWLQFYKMTVIFKNIFLCFDRLENKGKLNNVQTVCLGLFKNIIVLDTSIQEIIFDKILLLIYDERKNGVLKHQVLLKSLINMLNTLNVYDEIFKKKLLFISSAYFYCEASALFDGIPIITYLQYIRRRQIQEEERSESYLNFETGQLLLKEINETFIKNYLKEILQKLYDYLTTCDYNKIENHCNLLENWHLVYSLLHKLDNGISMLQTQFAKYIFEMGSLAIATDTKKSNTIQELINFKLHLDEIVAKCFDNNSHFTDEIRTNYIKIMSRLEEKSSYLLSNYIDIKIRKETDDNELEMIFNQSMVLFRFIQGKDLFEAFYRRTLAKRLIFNKLMNLDAEKSFISKLKQECGPDYTTRMEGMLQDINISMNLNYTFKTVAANDMGEFSVLSLTSNFWPSYINNDILLPEKMLKYQEMFEAFYRKLHNGKKLIWQPSLGQCILNSKFPKGEKQLEASLYQAVVLLLFNEYDLISYGQIKELTHLSDNELHRTLHSLSILSPNNVLEKIPSNNEIKHDDSFRFNAEFTNKFCRVHLKQVQLKDTESDIKQTEKNIMLDRQFQIDAAIVRIMKKKQTIQHNVLMGELLDVLKFPLKTHDLKKRIEVLIDRDYISRDKENSYLYTYIA